MEMFFVYGHNYGVSLYNGRGVGFTIEAGVNLRGWGYCGTEKNDKESAIA